MMFNVRTWSAEFLITRIALYICSHFYHFFFPFMNTFTMRIIFFPTKKCYFTFLTFKFFRVLFHGIFAMFLLNMVFQTSFIEINFRTMRTKVLFLIDKFRRNRIVDISVQLTFSERRIKITPQTYFQKFQTLQ